MNVAHFYDIESGRKELATRGHGKAHKKFKIPIPRNGGINDLLEKPNNPTGAWSVIL